MQKSNLILILTPYIVREQDDLRTVYERKMQERQEFLDHYFIFSDQTEYEPPKDYSRTSGLLEAIRQSIMAAEEEKKLEELTRPREMKTHEPGQPLELPTTFPRGGATSASAPAAAVPPPSASQVNQPPPPLNVSPAARTVEKLEK
jgi:general secretion pathway protein D